jgi:hypothetical protein
VLFFLYSGIWVSNFVAFDALSRGKVLITCLRMKDRENQVILLIDAWVYIPCEQSPIKAVYK